MLFIKFFLMLVCSLTLFGETIDLNAIAKKAHNEHKTVLVFFHTESCPYCKKMIKENFKNKEIMETIDQKFIFVDLLLDHNEIVKYKNFKSTSSKFAEHFDIQFYPTILFMDNNVVVSRIKGYRNNEKFRTILEYIHTKSYESMDLETFMAELEMMKD